MHNVDEVLNDLGLNIGRFTRARQWLEPVNPAAYRRVAIKLQRRLAASNNHAEGGPGGR